MGALSDLQAARVKELVASAGCRIDDRSLPTLGHSLHGQDPAQFTAILSEWAASLA